MCGIAGYSGTFEASLLARMSALIAHRGPDGEGQWIEPRAGVGLAHRRLAILDLTSTGAQPMTSDDGSVCVAFNGEIYNHSELREELRAKGFVFRGRSDTEVLLKAYLAWGESCFARFNGMFALAMWTAAHAGRCSCAIPWESSRSTGPRPRRACCSHPSSRRCSRTPACPAGSIRRRSRRTSRFYGL